MADESAAPAALAAWPTVLALPSIAAHEHFLRAAELLARIDVTMWFDGSLFLCSGARKIETGIGERRPVGREAVLFPLLDKSSGALAQAYRADGAVRCAPMKE